VGGGVERRDLPWFSAAGRRRVSPWQYEAYGGDRWPRAGSGVALHLVRRPDASSAP